MEQKQEEEEAAYQQPDTIWAHTEPVPFDPVFGLIHAFLADKNPSKALLGVGIYKGEDGKPFILKTVKKAERIMFENETDKEYTFPDGFPAFREKALNVSWGADHPCIKEGRVASCQTISGSGGLRLGFILLKKYFPKAQAYVPDPTWSLHHNLIEESGFDLSFFRYYDQATKGINFPGMIEDLTNMEDEQILLLQVSCHNPSGCDPTKEQWLEIFRVVMEKRHFVFFDSAYQGFASEDMHAENWPLHYLAERYSRVMCAQSFSKNMGLYGERTGVLSMVCSSQDEKAKVQTLLKDRILPQYANPPIHGARIVNQILGDEELTKEWKEEVISMQRRLKRNRVEMVEKLKELGSTHNWDHITNQIGMFAFTGFKDHMVDRLKNEFAIYMPYDGRICVASITQTNIDYCCVAFHAVTDGHEL